MTAEAGRGPWNGSPLWRLSATELFAAYAQGLSPSAVLDATLERVAAVNPAVNAIVTLDAAGAVRAAEASTHRWRVGTPLGPLDGVPITIKDNILVADLRATWGSRLYHDYVPHRDERPVQRLREAGAVILGKTNVPELTLHGFTDNAIFGVTRNPWDLALTPGGSSGGAAAAVASGFGPLALCTDGGGSIRRPAAHTGLVGFKPSRGMVPRGDGFPPILHDFEVIGPLARCVDDVALVMSVIAPEWPSSEHAPSPGRARIAFAPTFGEAPVDPLIAEAVANAVAALERQGHAVHRLESFRLADPVAAIWPVISQTGVAWLMRQHPGHERLVGTAIAEMAAAGARYTAADYLEALTQVATVRRAFEHLFVQFDLLITPTTAAMPWAAALPHPEKIANVPVGPRGHAVFTPFVNALGLPAVSLPCQIAGAMPIGLQVSAAWNCDAALLAFARGYEREFGSYSWPSV